MKTRIGVSTFIAIACMAAGSAHAADNPLDPSYMTPQEMAYWKKEVGAMADTRGMITKQSFISYYEKLWDGNVASGKAISVDELTDKWAAMEAKQANDPGYKPRMARRDHVAMMDVDNDGTVSREEFLKHMEMHWAEAEKVATKPVLTMDQAMSVMNPLDPSYRHK